MSQELLNDIASFHHKKDDILKNIGLLNNLSEKLTLTIHDEERKMHDNKIKDVIDSKKTQTENELQLLTIENKKMEDYLEILSRKQELEIKYLEHLCEQRSRVEKMGEKYPHIEIKEFTNYEDYYNKQLQTTKSKIKKKKRQNIPHQNNYSQLEDYTRKLYEHYYDQHQQMQQMQQYIQTQNVVLQKQNKTLSNKGMTNIPFDDSVGSIDENSTESSQKKKSIPPPPPTTINPDIARNQNNIVPTNEETEIDAAPSFSSIAPLFPLSNQLKNPNNIKSLKRVEEHDSRQKPRRKSLTEQFTSMLDDKFAVTRMHNEDSSESESELSD